MTRTTMMMMMMMMMPTYADNYEDCDDDDADC